MSYPEYEAPSMAFDKQPKAPPTDTELRIHALHAAAQACAGSNGLPSAYAITNYADTFYNWLKKGVDR